MRGDNTVDGVEEIRLFVPDRVRVKVPALRSRSTFEVYFSETTTPSAVSAKSITSHGQSSEDLTDLVLSDASPFPIRSSSMSHCAA